MEIITDEAAAIERRITADANYSFGGLDRETRLKGLNHIRSLRSQMASFQRRNAKREKDRLHARVLIGAAG